MLKTDPSSLPAPAVAPESSVPTPQFDPDKQPPKWLQRMAESRYAVQFMALLSLLDACISPILPEVLLIPLCLGNPKKRWVYGVWASVASVVGAVVGYYLGYWLWEAGLREFTFEYVPGFDAEGFAKAELRFGENAFLWIVMAAFTPLPFKVFTVAAGACHAQVSIEVLIAASIVGRLPRFLLEVWLIDRFGPDVLKIMRKPAWRIALLLTTLIALLVILFW